MSNTKKTARKLPFGLLDGRKSAALVSQAERDRKNPVLLREARRLAKELAPLLGKGEVQARRVTQGAYDFPTAYVLKFTSATLLLGRYEMESDSGGVVSNKRGGIFWGGCVPDNRDPSIVVAGGPGRYWRFADEHTPDDETLVKAVRAAMTEAGFEDVSYFDGGMERAIFDWMESPAGQEWLRKQAENKVSKAK
jgi:hypothetical protein